jgi:hypothetical protein
MEKMNYSQWFSDQLQTSADGLVWSIEQVPVPRRTVLPPVGLGDWSAARHVFHLCYYEQTLALPGMRQWLGDAIPSSDDLREETAWSVEKRPVESLVADFKKVRAEEVALLSKFDDRLWNVVRETVWGSETLLWVVSKTYQHTAEHTSDVLRIALFWDRFAARQADDDEA